MGHSASKHHHHHHHHDDGGQANSPVDQPTIMMDKLQLQPSGSGGSDKSPPKETGGDVSHESDSSGEESTLSAEEREGSSSPTRNNGSPNASRPSKRKSRRKHRNEQQQPPPSPPPPPTTVNARLPRPPSIQSSLHENLVRERDVEQDFDDIYEVLDDIGQGGLCQIYKIKKRDDKIGGSSRAELQRKNKKRSWRRIGFLRLPSSPSVLSLKRMSESASVASFKTLEQQQLSGHGTTSRTQMQQSHRESSKQRLVQLYHDDNLPADGEETAEIVVLDDPPTPPSPGAPPPIPSPARMTSSSTNSLTALNKELYFALKVINLSLVTGGSQKVDELKNEVEVLKTLDHRSIIKAYETFQRKDTKQIVIVMELCTGGCLYQRIPYTERQVARVIKQVLSALCYMHDRGIIHRDIKMENIMFESEHPEAAVKVIDFGLSSVFTKSDNVLKERVGTLYSMSPETMQGNYTQKADLWSVGVCTYIMLSGGEKPFEGKTPKQLVTKILLGQYDFDQPVWDSVSDQAKDFIRKLLVVKPEERMTAAQAIRHPFIASLSNKTTNSYCSFDGEIICTKPSKESSDGGATAEDRFDEIGANQELKDRITSSIVEYASSSEFRKLALNVIAKKSSAEEIFELRKVFDEFDTESTGTITLSDFKQILAKYNYSEADIFKIFRKVDVNRNNVINYTEFLAAALETQGAIEEYRLAEAFDMMDLDDSGYITREDLRKILGGSRDEAYIDRLIQDADFKKDGRISYEEFLQVFSERTRDRVYDMYEMNRNTEPAADDVLARFGLLKSFRRRRGDSTSSATHRRTDSTSSGSNLLKSDSN